MSKITETMSLIDFPKEAAEFFEEVLAKIEADAELNGDLLKLEEMYVEKLCCPELEERVDAFGEKSGLHKFTVGMLLVLCCSGFLKKKYLEKGYTVEFFADNMRDLTYKAKECKNMHGFYGAMRLVWYNEFFTMERFALGRLQYEHYPLDFDYKDVLKKGDDVINIHIPSSGPLLPEEVKKSLKMAYEFFGPNYGDRVMFRCATWMLYPPIIKLLPENSNIKAFYELFDIFREAAPANWHLWRIFGVETDDYKSLPQNTSLQKILYKFLNEGNQFGVVTIISLNTLKIKKGSLKANDIIEKAKKEAEKNKRESILETKEELHKLKLETEKEVKEKKQEIKEAEERLLKREDNIDRRDLALQTREDALSERENSLIERQKEIQEQEEQMEEIRKQEMEKLESIGGFTRQQARDAIMKSVEEKMAKEVASYIKEQESIAKIESDNIAKEMLVNSMQRYAADVTNNQTVYVISLPNDEMKGRIIGREGRNVRTIEAVTGVDLIIDDTPEAIVISSFDPLRREIARLTLETLISDGRIHPARIEEVYDKVCNDIKASIREYGKNAIYSLGLSKMDADLIEIVGKLHFRTSYSQNALQHSIEVANISGLLASELGENVNLAKRAGLLHDIGKAIDYEMEGSHIQIGAELAKKYGEDEVVINSILSHHGDHDATSIISSIVAIADTISASRPGARNDTSENYFQRLEKLESIGASIPGVDKAYAVQAGRELRVTVKPEQIDDLTSFQIAREIKEKIEAEMQYPGTIKVTVIRETRAQEEAK